MTAEMMSLQALLEKSSDTDLLREMICFAAQRLMELEVETLTGAGHGKRSAARTNHRNGYRERDWASFFGCKGFGTGSAQQLRDRPPALVWSLCTMHSTTGPDQDG